MFGKKKFSKNVSRDNRFMKDYAIRTEGLLMFAKEDGEIRRELLELKDAFQYTVASSKPEAQAFETKIEKDFSELTSYLQHDAWAEDEILALIKAIRINLVEISALR